MLLHRLFSRQWWLATLLVLLGTLVLIRLGIWQLDRLEARLAFNARVEAARQLPDLNLNAGLSTDLVEMEWRGVQVTGQYDFENQIALRNQVRGATLGYHLLTPLLFSETAVLVDRGFIPAEGNSTPEDWRKYDEPGRVNVTGQIRLGQGKPVLGGVADALPVDGSRLTVWNNADVAKIASQLPYDVLPVYIQPDAPVGDSEFPIPYQPVLELNEGPHFGYALQWFTFAAILFFGYPFFLKQQESKKK